MLKLYEPRAAEILIWYQGLQGYRYGLDDYETVDSFQRKINFGAVRKEKYGIFYLTNIHDPRGNAYGHCYFWDRKTRGRGQKLQELMNEIMPVLNLHRITVIVPVQNRITARWLIKNGFNLEGILRAYLMFQGMLHDCFIFAYYNKEIKKQVETVESFPKRD